MYAYYWNEVRINLYSEEKKVPARTKETTRSGTHCPPTATGVMHARYVHPIAPRGGARQGQASGGIKMFLNRTQRACMDCYCFHKLLIICLGSLPR